MNNTEAMLLPGLFLILALVAVAATPSLERLAGGRGGTAGLLLEITGFSVALLLGILSGDAGGRLVALLGSTALVWCAINLIRYRTAARDAAAANDAAEPVVGGTNCRSRKTTGSAHSDGTTNRTWRSHLFANYSTSPSNGSMTEKAEAWGGAYYGIYITSGHATATPVVNIICEDGDGGKCLADASEVNPNNGEDPPVQVQILNNVSQSGSRVRVAVVMSAALNASGGPTLTIAPGGVGGSIAWPDASFHPNVPMGTYRWVCEPSESTVG